MQRELGSQGGKGQPPEGGSLQPRLSDSASTEVPPSGRAPGVSPGRGLGAPHFRAGCWGGIYVTREGGREADEKSEICQRVGDELQEMLLSKNMPFLKGKQSLEGVRSPRGEESKTVRLTGRPVEQQRSPLPTHFPCG